MKRDAWGGGLLFVNNNTSWKVNEVKSELFYVEALWSVSCSDIISFRIKPVLTLVLHTTLSLTFDLGDPPPLSDRKLQGLITQCQWWRPPTTHTNTHTYKVLTVEVNMFKRAGDQWLSLHNFPEKHWTFPRVPAATLLLLLLPPVLPGMTQPFLLRRGFPNMLPPLRRRFVVRDRKEVKSQPLSLLRCHEGQTNARWHQSASESSTLVTSDIIIRPDPERCDWQLEPSNGCRCQV